MRSEPPPPLAGGQQPFRLLERWLAEGLTPGVAAVIAREGRLVGEFYGGSADGERPVTAETLFSLASITKLYTACAAMALVEDGLVALSEPLEPWLPEFAPEERGQLTLRRLLTHTSGLPVDLGPEELERIGPTPSLGAILGEYPRLRTIFPPGSQVRYSNVNFGILSLVVERATGSPFAEVVQRRIFAPLRLERTALVPPSESRDLLARVADAGSPGAPDEVFNSDWWRGLGLPYGGAFGPAREVARFLTACLADGAVAGFLSPTSLDAMTHPQTGDLAGGIPGLTSWSRADWGLGFELRGDKRLHYFGELTSPDTFGHLGASGTVAWADPESALVCVVLCNRAVYAERDRFFAAFCRFSNAVAALA